MKKAKRKDARVIVRDLTAPHNDIARIAGNWVSVTTTVTTSSRLAAILRVSQKTGRLGRLRLTCSFIVLKSALFFPTVVCV